MSLLKISDTTPPKQYETRRTHKTRYATWNRCSICNIWGWAPNYNRRNKYLEKWKCKNCKPHSRKTRGNKLTYLGLPRWSESGRLCISCGKYKPVTDFSFHHRSVDGYNYYCSTCRTNKEKNINNKNRTQAFEKYGKDCYCCSENNIKLLTIDHIGGFKGIEGSKKLGGNQLIVKLRILGWPEGFRTACWSCNIGSFKNGGNCPHEEK